MMDGSCGRRDVGHLTGNPNECTDELSDFHFKNFVNATPNLLTAGQLNSSRGKGDSDKGQSPSPPSYKLRSGRTLALDQGSETQGPNVSGDSAFVRAPGNLETPKLQTAEPKRRGDTQAKSVVSQIESDGVAPRPSADSPVASADPTRKTQIQNQEKTHPKSSFSSRTPPTFSGHTKLRSERLGERGNAPANQTPGITCQHPSRRGQAVVEHKINLDSGFKVRRQEVRPKRRTIQR